MKYIESWSGAFRIREYMASPAGNIQDVIVYLKWGILMTMFDCRKWIYMNFCGQLLGFKCHCRSSLYEQDMWFWVKIKLCIRQSKVFSFSKPYFHHLYNVSTISHLSLLFLVLHWIANISEIFLAQNIVYHIQKLVDAITPNYSTNINILIESIKCRLIWLISHYNTWTWFKPIKAF